MSNIPIFPSLSNEQNNINISSNLNNINDNNKNLNFNNLTNLNDDKLNNNNIINENNNNNNEINDKNNNNNFSSSENFQSVFNIQKDPKTSLIKANNFTYNEILNFSSIGLTAYESICNPRIIINENNVKFTKYQIERVINEMLRCSICYDIFHDPVNLKKCLHKFCKKCIGDYNRKIKKECIICRNHIETRRLMKEDEKIKEIIDCIIPNVDLFKIEEDKELTKKIKDCLYKDEDKIKNQIEKTKKEDENESKEIKEKLLKLKGNENEFNNNIIIPKNEQNIIDVNNNLIEKRINLNENDNIIHNEQEQKIIEKFNYINKSSNNNFDYKNNQNLNNNNENNLDFSSFLNKKINRDNYPIIPNLNNININNFNNNNNNINNLNLFNNNINNNLNYNQNLKKINENNLISQTENFYDYYNNNNSSMNILIKINCDEAEEDSLKKHFIQTRMKIQDFYTLDFISRFIVFKQNFKCDQIKKIIFYTLDSNNSKKYWKDHNIKIKAIVDFDRKIPQKLLESQKKISEFMYNNTNPIEYYLNLYFEISN